MAQAGLETGYLEALRLSWADTERGIGPTAAAIRTVQPVVARNIPAGATMTPWSEAAIQHGYSASAALPLARGNRVLGAMTVYAAEPDIFDAGELELLTDLASNVACGIAALRTSAERENTEEALRISHQRLADIIEFLPDATFVIDQDKRVVAWNRACEIMTGVKKEAVLGLADYAYDELIFGEQKPILIDLLEMPSSEVESKYKYVNRTGNRFFAECFNPRLRDGRGAHLWIAATPLFDREKRCCGAIEVIRDVTDQKRIEEALRESEEKFFAAFNCAPVMAAITVLEDGTFLDVNNKFLEVSGFTREEVLGRTFVEVGWLRAEDRLRLVEALRKQGKVSDMEFTAHSRDGRPIHCLYCCELVTIGGVKRLLTMSPDITERKLGEQALRESELKYRELVELANSIILRWTHDGRITFLNEFGQRFFGYSAEEIIGRHVVGTIVPPVESGGRDLRRLMEQICADPSAFEQNVNENMRRNGAHVWIAWANKMVWDAQGRVAEILSVGTDITESKRAQEAIRDLNITLEQRVAERTAELAVARDRAEAADRLKSAFLASMSHELRTPLNSIIGFTGIILQGLAGPLNAEQRKQLEMVRDSSRHLLSLINDVLDISKIEAGQLEVRSEPFDLRASIVKVAGIVKPLAEKKGLALRVELAPEIGTLTSDPRRVEQVLLNLLNNAIKFTEQGTVTLTAEIAPATLRTPYSTIRICVADTGIGIKPEDLSKLFQPFRQIESGLSRRHEGTGLGLAISRRLTDLLGGQVQAASDWGKGSVFTLTLPMQEPGES